MEFKSVSSSTCRVVTIGDLVTTLSFKLSTIFSRITVLEENSLCRCNEVIAQARDLLLSDKRNNQNDPINLSGRDQTTSTQPSGITGLALYFQEKVDSESAQPFFELLAPGSQSPHGHSRWP